MLNLPKSIFQNDTDSWVVDPISGCPSAQWALVYYFAQGASKPVVLTATPALVGNGWQVDSWVVPLTPGTWQWTARAESANGNVVVGTGSLIVNPDAALAYDRRSKAERDLAAVDAALSGRLTEDFISYKIDGLELSKVDHKRLLELRSIFRTLVRVERGGRVLRATPVRLGKVW